MKIDCKFYKSRVQCPVMTTHEYGELHLHNCSRDEGKINSMLNTATTMTPSVIYNGGIYNAQVLAKYNYAALRCVLVASRNLGARKIRNHMHDALLLMTRP